MTSKAQYSWQDNICILKLTGEVRFTDCPSIDKFIKSVLAHENHQMLVDLSETTLLDSTALGMLAQIAIKAREQQKTSPTLSIQNNDLRVLLQSVCFDRVFSIIQISEEANVEDFSILDPIDSNDDELALQVLKAHKNLMQLSFGNQLNFHDVLDALD
ncbi:MAG: hypothetical protein COW84_05405, partial [Gammaproteobacteria bacterium CG22_combo_CG10-13_8_21_14_all_40_8]